MPQKASGIPKISKFSREACPQTSLGELQAAGAFGPNLFSALVCMPPPLVSFPDPPSGGCGERERRRVWAITPGGSVQEECCGYTIIERVCGFCGLASRTRIHTGMCNSPPTIFCTRKELQRRRWRFVRYAVKTSLRTGVQGLS